MKKIVILAENLVRSGNSRDLLDWSKTLENLENSLEILYSFKLKLKPSKTNPFQDPRQNSHNFDHL